MGTWGTGIFDDDVASDVQETYRDLVGEGVPDDDATRDVLAEFAEDGQTPPVVWLALAAAQHRVGRLATDVRDRALAIIDDGSDLRRWAEASPSDCAAARPAWPSSGTT